MQWAVGLQQWWRRLFVRQAEVAAYCAKLARAGPGYVYVFGVKACTHYLCSQAVNTGVILDTHPASRK